MIPSVVQDLDKRKQELIRNFVEEDPKGPDATKIALLHRGHDGYITFHSTSPEDGKPYPGCAIRADALEGMFPAIANALIEDAYFSVNAFAVPNKEKGNLRTKASIIFKSRMLRYLCSAHVDIDWHTVQGITEGQVIGQVIDAEGEGKIPSPSVYVQSGRGLWLFWFLVDEHNRSLPPRAVIKNVILWRAIERKILKLFGKSGSDANATKTTQITRVPGSLNTKSGKPVKWLLPGQGKTTAYTYTLRELADWFGVGTADEEYEKASRKIPNNSRGWKALHKGRLEQFEVLRQIRGGFKEGMRNSALFIYANILKKNGFSTPELIDAVEKLASECKPSYLFDEYGRPSDQATMTAIQVAGRRHGFKLRDEYISDNLQITPDEQRLLAEHFGEKAWPCSSRYERRLKPSSEEQDAMRATRDRERQGSIKARRQRLIELFQETPGITIRELSSALRKEGFSGSSVRSVKLELDRLGIKTAATETKIRRARLLELQTSMQYGRRPELK